MQFSVAAKTTYSVITLQNGLVFWSEVNERCIALHRIHFFDLNLNVSGKSVENLHHIFSTQCIEAHQRAALDVKMHFFLENAKRFLFSLIFMRLSS